MRKLNFCRLADLSVDKLPKLIRQKVVELRCEPWLRQAYTGGVNDNWQDPGVNSGPPDAGSM